MCSNFSTHIHCHLSCGVLYDTILFYLDTRNADAQRIFFTFILTFRFISVWNYVFSSQAPNKCNASHIYFVFGWRKYKWMPDRTQQLELKITQYSFDKFQHRLFCIFFVLFFVVNLFFAGAEAGIFKSSFFFRSNVYSIVCLLSLPTGWISWFLVFLNCFEQNVYTVYTKWLLWFFNWLPFLPSDSLFSASTNFFPLILWKCFYTLCVQQWTCLKSYI